MAGEGSRRRGGDVDGADRSGAGGWRDAVPRIAVAWFLLDLPDVEEVCVRQGIAREGDRYSRTRRTPSLPSTDVQATCLGEAYLRRRADLQGRELGHRGRRLQQSRTDIRRVIIGDEMVRRVFNTYRDGL